MGWGKKTLFKRSRSHDQDGRHAHIRQNLLLRNKKADDLFVKVGMHHPMLENYQIYSNNHPELTLTYFMDFSETIVVYDIKVGRCG